MIHRLRSRRNATTNGNSRQKMTNGRTSARRDGFEVDDAGGFGALDEHAAESRRLGVHHRELVIAEVEPFADGRDAAERPHHDGPA